MPNLAVTSREAQRSDAVEGAEPLFYQASAPTIGAEVERIDTRRRSEALQREEVRQREEARERAPRPVRGLD